MMLAELMNRYQCVLQVVEKAAAGSDEKAFIEVGFERFKLSKADSCLGLCLFMCNLQCRTDAR